MPKFVQFYLHTFNLDAIEAVTMTINYWKPIGAGDEKRRSEGLLVCLASGATVFVDARECNGSRPEEMYVKFCHILAAKK
jgi:hypothetical protein